MLFLTFFALELAVRIRQEAEDKHKIIGTITKQSNIEEQTKLFSLYLFILVPKFIMELLVGLSKLEKD